LREFRLRLKEEEAEELKEALARHIERLVKSRSISWERYIMLRRFYYRMSWAGKRRGGVPAKVYGFHSSEEEMIRDMESWVRHRIMEIENSERRKVSAHPLRRPS